MPAGRPDGTGGWKNGALSPFREMALGGRMEGNAALAVLPGNRAAGDGNAALRRFPVPVCALRAGTGTTKSFSVRKETILKENGVKMRILGNHGAGKNMKSAGFAGICRKMANSVDNRRKLAGIFGKLHRLRWINARIIF